MKTFLVVVFALIPFCASAQKHMVTLSGFDTGDSTDRSLDFSTGHGGANNVKESNVALNYAYAISDMFQLGFKYWSHEETSGGDVLEFGDKYYGGGVYAIANLANKLTDTPYILVGYSMMKTQDSDDKLDLDDDGEPETDYNIESDTGAFSLAFGYRWNMGNIWGMNFNFSPSINLAFLKVDQELKVSSEGVSVKDKASTTVLSLNLVKFDVLF
jgi:hypothetical protein